VGRRHRACGAVVEEARASLLNGLEGTGRRVDVEEAGVSHSSGVGSGSKRRFGCERRKRSWRGRRVNPRGWSNRGRSDVRALVLPNRISYMAKHTL
jgi:hypothetical protein